MAAPNPYLTGLDLAGRVVVLVGGGTTVARRVHRLLASGAHVTVVAPEVQTAVEGLAADGRLTWLRRPYQDGDLAEAWYAMAATDDPVVNERVVAEADRRRVFCVRADRGSAGSAVTAAVGSHGAVQIGVLAGGDHGRSGRVRDLLLERLAALDHDPVTDPLRPGPAPGPTPGQHAADRTAAQAPGRVALVGGGPGDPDLLTVRGARLLAQADVVVADRLAPGELLERVRADAEIVDASKLPYGRAIAQEDINAVLVDRARAGKNVVRLKGGDPFVFGRGYEELLALTAAGVPTTVVPGVTSAVAVPSLAGVPVTQRGEVHEFVVVSGHLPPGHPDSLTDWEALGRLRGTVVVLMGRRNAEAIAAALQRGGRAADTPVAVVQDGSMPGQRRVDTTLAGLAAALAEHAVRSPVVIVVGPTARFALTPVALTPSH